MADARGARVRTSRGRVERRERGLGQSEFLRQNLVAASEHLARAVELNPKLSGAHSLYGQVLRGLTKLDAAAEQFRAEMLVNPYDFVANTETAMQLKQDGKFDEALAHLGRALQVRPGDPGARYQRASIQRAAQAEPARLELEQLVRDFPSFAEAHATLATVSGPRMATASAPWRGRRRSSSVAHRNACRACSQARPEESGRGRLRVCATSVAEKLFLRGLLG